MSNSMQQLSSEAIKQRLADFSDGIFLSSDLSSNTLLNQLQSVDIIDNSVRINFNFDFAMGDYEAQLMSELEQWLLAGFPESNFVLKSQWQVKAHEHPAKVQAMPTIKNIIAVASGKGGVGKSTTSVNLALALDSLGAKVGILDADIYGPSIPLMLGLQDRQPERSSAEKKAIMPLMGHGLESMSIGYLVKPEQATVWRGPMASGALQQLVNDTQWGELDYLIIDLPPGTGDIQLTMAQKIPVTAAVVVTTPQDIALADARKAVNMFNKVSVPVLGVVENMATHICSNCSHEEAIFGFGGGERLAQEIGVSLLGSLPLSMSIRQQADSGKPTVVAEGFEQETQLYQNIALTMCAKLSLEKTTFKADFPTITISND